MDVIERIYLNISGFYLQINLLSTENNYLKNKFKKDIVSQFSGFIVKKENITIDFSINVCGFENIKTIYKEKQKTFFFECFFFERKNLIRTYYHISYIQWLLLIDQVLQMLLSKNNGFIMHASSINMLNKALIFTGPSGAGKSTIMKLLSSKYSALADDSIIIRKENRDYFLYQTPIVDKTRWVKKNKNKYLIKQVYFLKKSKIFKVEKNNNKKEIFKKLISQLFINQEKSKKQIISLSNFVKEFDEFLTISFSKNKKKLLELF